MRNSTTIIVFFAILVFVAWLIYRQNHFNPAVTSQPQQSEPAKNALAIGQRTKESGCVVQGPLPDSQCTPGAIFPNATVREICVPGYTKTVRNVPVALKHQVYADYGIHRRSPGEYEVDHLIPLGLGGSNDIANLFPEAADPRPGYHEKDRVDSYLHDAVCAGRMDLKAAQTTIANDWLSFYKRMNEAGL